MRPSCLTLLCMACGLAIGGLFVAMAASPATATPLEPDKCVQLKADRDTLAATGVGELVRQKPSDRRAELSAERLKQVRALINLDGQLRFRCGIDLLLPTLKPDPVEEFVDAGDTAGSGRPSPRAPVIKKAKAPKAPPDQAQVAAPAAPGKAPAVGSTVPPTPRTAAIKTGTTADQAEPAVKPIGKARPKAEDAYRAPASGDPNATSLDKQIPKSQ